MKPFWTAVVLVLLVGCGTSSRVVRLETGPAQPIVFTARSSARTVELEAGEFKDAMTKMSREVSPSPQPQEAARRLFEVPVRSESYTYEPRGHRLLPLGSSEDLLDGSTPAEVELTRAYLHWCESRGRPVDCLRLLRESPIIVGDGRLALAMGMAQGVVWDEMLDVFKDMANPHALVSAVLWTWTTYMILLTVPEPFSKGVAAVMTVTLISYVGVDTFWGLILGFRRLMEEADRATTFDELRQSGERYGKMMGRQAARAFAMLAMAAIGNTTPGLAARLPRLPGAMQATVQAETQIGVRLAAVGQVDAVTISAEAVTLALAPGAVAMTARGGVGEHSRGAERDLREESSNTKPQQVYTGLKNTPGYPTRFRAVQNGTTKNTVARKDLLEMLRAIEPGDWLKVYKDGWIGNQKVSLHYFESPSGKVFDFKIKQDWSNQ